MSSYANEAHVKQYTARTAHLLQQKGSKLVRYSNAESYKGKEAQVVQQYGSVEAQEITSRHADTVHTDTPQTSRWVRPSDWGVADMVDKQDIIRSLTDPKNAFATAQAMGLGRKQDDVWISAALGNNYIGEDGSTVVSAASDGVITVDRGTKLTVSTLREVKKNFAAAEMDMDSEMLFCAVTAEQIDDLYEETQVISIDYNTNRVLVDGKVQSFMGFNFVHTERLGVDASSKRRCIAWAKSGMTFATWDGIHASVDPLPTKWNNWQVMTQGTFGATRTEGEKVQEVLVVEA